MLVGKEAMMPDKAIYWIGSLSLGFYLKGVNNLFENS